jgi:hypothetical protein
VGQGTNSTLLNGVPVRVWRTLNGFPPDYYEPSDKASKSKEKNNEIFHFIFCSCSLGDRRNNQRMKQNLNNKWNSRLMNTWGM